MKIHFNGAARTVTGSQHLLEINGFRILLECGLFQGRRIDTYELNQNFRFDPSKIDAVILSHAHIDHSGNLPNLVKNGYKKKIYATPATAALCDVMLRDAGHIQESDAKYVNKKKRRRGEPLIEPLYTMEDAADAVELFHSVEYEQPFEPAPGVTARFVEAGHILGSASIILDIEENGRKFRLWFSGDIGRMELPLMRDPVLPQGPDYLIMECTYGDKAHRDPESAYIEFRDVVKRTIERGGKVIVPAFAVGRTQELVYDLNRMFTAGEVPRVPVYVDSPLAVNASDIFRKFSHLFDEETRQFVAQGKHPALTFDRLVYTRSVEESKALNERSEPMVIISASGMAETGRILHHLRNNIENSKNSIVIVSWQAPHTLGRRLAERNPEVKIFGELFEVRAEVATIGGLSAHAGQKFLVEYARAAGNPKQIFLVHGEQDAYDALRQKMIEAGLQKPVYPEMYGVMEI